MLKEQKRIEEEKKRIEKDNELKTNSMTAFIEGKVNSSSQTDNWVAKSTPSYIDHRKGYRHNPINKNQYRNHHHNNNYNRGNGNRE